MADQIVQTSGHSKEQVAYMLLERIAHSEGKALSEYPPKADKKWILETFAECLATVHNPGLKWEAK